MTHRLIGLTACVVALAVAACGGQREMLQPVGDAGPGDTDLSGDWRMLDDFSVMRERIERAINATDGVDERDRFRGILAAGPEPGRRSSRRSDVGGLVHVFLENAERLRITQTDAGLFVGFGRSVVEEYRFGETRMVSIGGARAQRASGWVDGDYVIETLGEEGMKLTERYSLSDSGKELSREIVLRSAEMERVTIVQTYGRRDGTG